MTGRKADPIVLGIDAAWTPSQPSGVALVQGRRKNWRLVAAASSYETFLGSGENCCEPPSLPVDDPQPDALLSRAAALAGGQLSLIAVDMPLSLQPITGRRSSDDCVSRAFAAMGCGTHTPNASRPGLVSQKLRERFAAAGYPLATTTPLICPALIEVYPHPALLSLMQARFRIKYKVSRMHRYWPDLHPAERRTNLLRTWEEIVAALEAGGISLGGLLRLPPGQASRKELKSFEDMLDAVICAWVGMCVLQGHAVAYGDNESAIWIPALTSPGPSEQRTVDGHS